MIYGSDRLNRVPLQSNPRIRTMIGNLEETVGALTKIKEKPLGDYTNSQRDSMRNAESDNLRSNMDAHLKSLVKKPASRKNLLGAHIRDFEDNHASEYLVDFEPGEFESSFDSTKPMYTVTFKAANGWNSLTLPEEKINLLLETLNKKAWGGVRVGITFHENNYFSGMDWGYIAEFYDSKQDFSVRNEMTEESVAAKKIGSEKIKAKSEYEGKVFENAYAFRGGGGEKTTIQNYMISGKIKSIHSARRPILN